MKSIEFLEELKDLKNFKNIEIGSIHLDSRDVQKDGIFFAHKGNDMDGNTFIKSALDKGAALVGMASQLVIDPFQIPHINSKLSNEK